MTSEIILMNRNVLTIGADSAMTSWAGGRYRIANEAEKIFTFGDKSSLAIMIYNSADILGHPWQSVIGEFMDTHRKTDFSSVEDLAATFFAYLDNHVSLFEPEEEERWFALTLNVIYSQIVHLARERLNFAGMTDDRSLGREEAMVMAINFVHRAFHDEDGKPLPNLDCFSDTAPEDVYSKFSDTVDAVIRDHFGDVTQDEGAIAKLREIAGFAVVKELFLERMIMSGLVFAGFGSDQMYPTFDEYFVSTVFNNRVKRRRHYLNEVSNKNQASVSFFADSDASVGFLRGIDSDTAGFLFGASEFFLTKMSGPFVDQLDFLDATQKQKLTESIAHQFSPLFHQSLLGALDQKVEMDRITPFLDVVNSMGPEEMGTMTADLVNLNILRKKVVNEEGTVGGPVRVFTMSKRGGTKQLM